jgi:hypothetical protein
LWSPTKSGHLLTSQDRVVIVLREASGTGILAGKGDDREVILRVGYPRGLGSDDGDDLDVFAPPGLVAKGFEPDSSARGGGEGLSDDAGTLVPGHTPWLPLKADLRDVRRSFNTADSVLSTISCRT